MGCGREGDLASLQPQVRKYRDREKKKLSRNGLAANRGGRNQNRRGRGRKPSLERTVGEYDTLKNEKRYAGEQTR